MRRRQQNCFLNETAYKSPVSVFNMPVHATIPAILALPTTIYCGI